jgi:hypothetical protein
MCGRYARRPDVRPFRLARHLAACGHTRKCHANKDKQLEHALRMSGFGHIGTYVQ